MRLESPMTVHSFFSHRFHVQWSAVALAAMILAACYDDPTRTAGPTASAPGPVTDALPPAQPVQCELSTEPWVAGENLTVTDYVTSVRSQSSFDLGGRPVLTTAATAFDPSSSVFPNYIHPDVQLQVSGTVDQSGSLVAGTVRRGPEPGGAISGPIQEIYSGGLVRVLGFDLGRGSCQRVFDLTSSFADPQRIEASDLKVGDSVEVALVSWYAQEPGGVILRITRRPPDDLVEIRGWYASKAREPTFVVNGNTVRVTESTRFFQGHQFFGDGPGGCSCAPADASAFWQEVKSGAYAAFGVIEVKGVLQAGEILATEVYWYYI